MATNTATAFSGLPATGFVRQADLVGEAPVTPEEAEANKRNGRSPRRSRSGRPGFVPFSSATLWRKVSSGEFPAPVKLSDRVTAWRVEDVRAWMNERTSGQQGNTTQPKAVTAKKNAVAAATA